MWIRPSLRDAFKKETVVGDAESPHPSLIGGEKMSLFKGVPYNTILFILSIKRNNDAGVAACLYKVHKLLLC